MSTPSGASPGLICQTSTPRSLREATAVETRSWLALRSTALKPGSSYVKRFSGTALRWPSGLSAGAVMWGTKRSVGSNTAVGREALRVAVGGVPVYADPVLLMTLGT